MTRRVLLALLLLLALGPSAVAARREVDLPSSTAVTHFRSPVGRTIYLLYQDETADLRERAERIAQPLGAQVRVRTLKGLSVVRLAHPTLGLDVHRLGSRLRIDTTEANLKARPGGVSTGAERTDEDVDQALLIKARHIMGSEEVPAEIVTLAQGAAARSLLSFFVAGDDLGVILHGQRTLPFLNGHPDAQLLRRVIELTRDTLEAEFENPATPPPIDGQPAPVAWNQAVGAAQKTAAAVRARLKTIKTHPPDKEESP